MKKTLLLSALALVALATSATTVTYTVDDNTWFRNPERGWYHQSQCDPRGNGSDGGLGWWSGWDIDGSRSLLLRIYYMDYYNDGKAFTQADLNMFDADLAQARRDGIKLILRYAYGENGYNDDEYNWSFTEPTKEKMMAHMEQLQPILAKNADVIACVQAGFVGIWGEWFYTSTFGRDWSKKGAVADRNDLINKLLEMTPADRSLQLRTVHYITEYMGNGEANYKTQLTDQTAFSGSAQSRLGHHNDAICASEDNWGTFYHNEEFAYLANLSQYVPIGGESAGGDWNYYNGPKAYAFFEKYHYDYINRDYHSGVIDSWFNDRKDGKTYFDHITCRLGYRYALVSGTYANQVAPGGKMSVTLKIKNGGFSTLYNKRTAYIVLKNSSHTYKLPLASDPRLWKAGQTTTVTESLSIPSNAANGTYDLYLWMPDQYASLQNDDRYSVRMANANMAWTDGMNKLSAQVTITGTPSEGGDEGDDQDEDDPSSQSTDPCAISLPVSMVSAAAADKAGTPVSWSENNGVVTVNYSTNGDWGSEGIEYTFSARTDIDSISFDFRGTNTSCWVALFPYIIVNNSRIVDSSLDLNAGSDDGWQHVTVRPNKVLWGGDFTYSYQSVSKVGFLANPERATTSSFQLRNVQIHAQCPTPTQDILTPAALPAAHKFIRNGRLYILRNNHLYTPLGL